MTEYILITIIALAVILTIGVFLKARKRGLSEKDQQFFQEHWKQITAKLADDPNHAILDADKLIDKALHLKGYQGSLGEKLKKAGNLFGDINGLWSAHKLRNNIAHELNVKVSPKEATYTISSFKRALRDLGVKL